MHDRPSSGREGAPAALPSDSPDGRASSWAERLRATPVTVALIGSCVALQLLGDYWGRDSEAVLWHMGANSGEAVRQGEIDRLLACTFLHGGWLHLVMNMSVLLALSGLEVILSSRRFLVLYAASGLIGSLATALIAPSALSVGASGAIWGVMMAGFGFRIAARRVLALRGVRLGAGLVSLAVNIAISFLPGIDTTAHLGGGAAGFALGALVLTPRWMRGAGSPTSPQQIRASQRWFGVAAMFSGVLMAASLVTALALGRPWQFRDDPDLRRVQVPETPLSLELPQVLSGDIKKITNSEGLGFTYGMESRSPITLMVMSHQNDLGAIPEADDGTYQVIDRIYEMMQRAPEEQGVQRVSLAIVSLGGRRMIRQESRLEGGQRVLTFTHFLPDHSVTLMIWRRASWQDEVWPSIEERIASSVQLDARRERP